MQFIKIIFPLILFWNTLIYSQSESKSQSEIRSDKKFQVAGFIYKNDYQSILLSYNLNESFTLGIDARQVKIAKNELGINKSDLSNTKEKDTYLFLQWFPFKVGGLYLSARVGYYKVTVENENSFLKTYSHSNFYYEFSSMNLSKLMYGGGIGYRWVFENGLSLGIEAFESKHYKRSLRQYNFMVESDRQLTLTDYFISKYASGNYIAQPTNFFISIGYSF